MGRAAIEACLPWLGLLAVSLLAAYALVRLSRASLCLCRLRELHRNQDGGVQSLSFVLTLPVFVMVLLLIVQVSQLMIGTIVVHYAAFASARSAIVWIPATLGTEPANCISSFGPDPSASDQAPPMVDPRDPQYGPAAGGMTYLVAPGSPKYDKIASAAVLACMPISPSRDLGLDLPGNTAAVSGLLKAAYAAMSPDSAANARVPRRLENKLAYALANTEIDIRFFHKNIEPPLQVQYVLPPDFDEYRFNEIGWQDQITVTVRHNLALLPGPGRLLAHYLPGAGGVDRVSERIGHNGSVYTYPLSATATLGNEGEKLMLPKLVPYVQPME